MSTQVLLTVPDDLYRQVEKVADAASRNIPDLLLDTITRSLSPFPVDSTRPEMLDNAAAYRSLHAQLVKHYLGQFVAIHDGQLVDHDSDPVTLLQRVRTQFPDRVVLRRRVELTAERELHVRHPRIEAVV